MTTRENDAPLSTIQGTAKEGEKMAQDHIEDKDRAGVSKGKEGLSQPLYKDDQAVSITVRDGTKLKAMKLLVAGIRLNAANKYEYQLKEASGQLYKDGIWFPEIEVKLG